VETRKPITIPVTSMSKARSSEWFVEHSPTR
jgi:hypothetical protein